jgi:hypothetical protein
MASVASLCTCHGRAGVLLGFKPRQLHCHYKATLVGATGQAIPKLCSNGTLFATGNQYSIATGNVAKYRLNGLASAFIFAFTHNYTPLGPLGPVVVLPTV